MGNFIRTPEMTRQVKNIVDSINKHIKRLEKTGNYDILPERLKKSDVWKIINNSSNPQKTYDEMIGTKGKPGYLRMATPSNIDPNYRKRQKYDVIDLPSGRQPKITGKLRKYTNKIRNQQREKNRELQETRKREEFPQPEYMGDSEYNGVIDGLTLQGGPLNEETLPDDYEYTQDFDYFHDTAAEGDVEEYIANYYDAYTSYGFMPLYNQISNAIEALKKYNPDYLLEVFQSGDDESNAEFIYQCYADLWSGRRDRKTGNPRNYPTYIANMERIARYWVNQANIGLSQVGIDTTGYTYE